MSKRKPAEKFDHTFDDDEAELANMFGDADSPRQPNGQ